METRAKRRKLSAMMPSTSLEDLPDEIILKILAFLSIYWKVRCLRVSKRLRRISRQICVESQFSNILWIGLTSCVLTSVFNFRFRSKIIYAILRNFYNFFREIVERFTPESGNGNFYVIKKDIEKNVKTHEVDP